MRQAVARVGATEVATLAMTAAVQTALLERGPYQNGWIAGGDARSRPRSSRRRSHERASEPSTRRFSAGCCIASVHRSCCASSRDRSRVSARRDRSRSHRLRVRARGWSYAVRRRGISPRRCTRPSPASPGSEEPGEFAEHVHTVRLALEFVVHLVEKHEEDARGLHGTPSAVALDLYPEDLDRLGGLMPAIGTAVGAMR